MLDLVEVVTLSQRYRVWVSLVGVVIVFIITRQHIQITHNKLERERERRIKERKRR